MFQQNVTVQPAPGIPGTFCDKSPRTSVTAGPFGLVAGKSLFAARFAWTTGPLDSDGTPSVANSYGSGPVAGFCMNLHDTVNPNIFSETTMQILPGFAVTLMKMGGFWVVNNGLTLATKGMSAFANFADGTVSFGAPGSAGGSAAVTGAIAASTAAITGSIAGEVLNVSAVGAGVVVPGANVAGPGVAAGTQILQQLSGTPNGVGNYEVSIPGQTVPSAGLSLTYGTLTVSAVGSGVVGVGDTLSGGTVGAGTTIKAAGTGTGGTGTYYVSPNAVVASAALTVGTSVQTKWMCMSSGAPGEIVKMTNHLEG